MSKHIKVSISASVMEKLLEGNPRAHSVAQGAMRVAKLKEELFKARIAEEAAIREYETEQGRQRGPRGPTLGDLIKEKLGKGTFTEGDADLSAPMAPEGSYVPFTGTRSPRKARKGVRVPTVPINPPSPLRDPWKPIKEYEVSNPYDVEPELPVTELDEPNQPECKGWEANAWDACSMPLMKSFCVPPRLTFTTPCGCWFGVILFNPTLGETILMKSCGVLETVPAVNWIFARPEREFDGCGA